MSNQASNETSVRTSRDEDRQTDIVSSASAALLTDATKDDDHARYQQGPSTMNQGAAETPSAFGNLQSTSAGSRIEDRPWPSGLDRAAQEQMRKAADSTNMEEYAAGSRGDFLSRFESEAATPAAEGCEHQGEGDEPQVLDPENPFMLKFQNALKDLLQRQCEKLVNENLQLSGDLRIKDRQREELGEILYNLQEEICQISCQTESANNVITQLCNTRCSIQSSLKEVKESHKEKSGALEECTRIESKLRAELLAATNLLSQLKACEEDLESELSVSQCISEKTRKQKRDMCIEKRKQDIVLLRLQRTVVALAKERDELVKRAECKSAEREQLTCSLADASTDVEILQGEQTQLTRAWNGVILAITQRDHVYNNVNRELSQTKDSFYLLLGEVDRTRRSCKQEMLSNERLVGLLSKLQREYNELSSVHRKNQIRMEEVECNFCNAQRMLKDSEEQYACRQLENKNLQQLSSMLMKEYERYSQEKFGMEAKILDLLRDQGKHDKVFQHMAVKLQEMKDNNKRQELIFVVDENQISKLLVQIEEIKGAIELGKKDIEQLKEAEKAIGQEIASLEASQRKTDNEIMRRSQAIHQLKQKFDVSSCSGAAGEICSEDNKIKAIEAELDDVLEEVDKRQEFWLKLQGNIVKLAADRQEQLRQLDLLYKQSQILRQRNLKLEAEMDKIKEDESSAKREVHSLLVLLDRTCSSYYNQRKNVEKETAFNTTIMIEIEEHLKEAERKNLELEEELSDLRQSNLLLLNETNEKKRESFNWDKKIQMITEAREHNKESQKMEGEIGSMKLEIHRMKIRLSQLRKVQETLGKDLEQCVYRRAKISTLAEVREKRSTAVVSSRVVHERKMASFISKTKDAEQAMRIIKGNLSRIPERENLLSKQIEEACGRSKELENCISEIDRQIEEGQVLKQQNLDEIVRRQRKAKMYAKVKEGKHCLQFRTESRLQQEYCRQRSVNFNLQEVADLLMQDYPHLHLYLRRICNTLQVMS